MIGMGFRTIKTAIAAGLAIWLASLFELEFATFSAIIVIMCIEKTKKKTLITMKEKFVASLLSLVIGAVFFEVFGYHPIVFSVFIFLFIPLLVKMKIQGGFVTSMVVVLHVYTVQDATWQLFLNELYIIVIGMGIALLVNSFMPDFQKDIRNFKMEIEAKFKVILFEFAAYLRDPERNWNGQELLDVEDIINKAKSVAIQDVENHLTRTQNKDYYYLEMRENQVVLLRHIVRILGVISETDLHVRQKEMLADFLENLSKDVNDKNTTKQSFKELEDLKASMRKTELPKKREEFEVRANLFYLIFEMENYLKIKRKLFAGKP